jgi:hypothetical protein
MNKIKPPNILPIITAVLLLINGVSLGTKNKIKNFIFCVTNIPFVFIYMLVDLIE